LGDGEDGGAVRRDARSSWSAPLATFSFTVLCFRTRANSRCLAVLLPQSSTQPDSSKQKTSETTSSSIVRLFYLSIYPSCAVKQQAEPLLSIPLLAFFRQPIESFVPSISASRRFSPSAPKLTYFSSFSLKASTPHLRLIARSTPVHSLLRLPSLPIPFFPIPLILL
jgi:hypothetical protein